MSRSLILLFASATAIPISAQAQTASDPHAAHTAPAAPAAPAANPACLPEHAAMGHCTPAEGQAPAGQPVSPPTQPNPQAGHTVPALQKPNEAPREKRSTSVPSAADPSCPPEHAAMGHCTAKADGPHAGHSATAASEIAVTPPPAEALTGPEHAADTAWNPTDMAASRRGLLSEHGDIQVSKILIDRIEWANRSGKDGYALDAQAWWGGDIDKVWLKGEGEGAFGEDAENVEVQALWSHAIDPWFDLQLGVRHDFAPSTGRTYLVAGVQGLAPYWFEVDVAAFLSSKGELSARAEAEYDLRITQRLILQPRVELELAAQDMPELRVGSGLSAGELGLRLRYEFQRQFAPYAGVQYEHAFGDTADFRRTEGEGAHGWSFLLGVRAWF